MKKRRTIGLGLKLDVEVAQKSLEEDMGPLNMDSTTGGGCSTGRSKSVDV
jgi:hypothetical protein